MLFHYAVEATEENWLHDTIVAILSSGMDEVDANQARTAWPACIPAERRPVLSSKTGLRDHSDNFFEAYIALTPEERAIVRSALCTQNALPDIFDGQSARVSLGDIPDSIRIPTKSLFKFAFGLLTDLSLRDHHYQAIFDKLPRRFCPFCGLERLNRPSQPRHDLDHYLLFSVYPFAGANLRNLVPMGDRCNKSFKRQVDVIFDDVTNARRRCSDPYSGLGFSVTLTGTDLLSDDSSLMREPIWQIAFVGGEHDRAATWESVFQIRQRYSDLLNDEYDSWLGQFRMWSKISKNTAPMVDAPSAVDALNHYLELIQLEGDGDANFLRKAVFELFRDICATSPEAEIVVEWLRSRNV